MNSNKLISILGCGWLGFALAQQLIKDGHSIKGSTRTPSKVKTLTSAGIKPFIIDLSQSFDQSEFFESDVMIINIPPGRRDPDVASNYPARIKSALQAAKNGSITKVLLVSSTGVYASQEASDPNWNFPMYEVENPNAIGKSASALINAEGLLKSNFGKNGTILRFGGLVGGDRLAGRFLAGKKDVVNGSAPVNMIHRDDCIGIIQAIIHQNQWGKIYNATADNHPLRSDFYTTQAEKHGFEVPTFLEEKKASGKIVLNSLLKTDLKYTFHHPDPMLF